MAEGSSAGLPVNAARPARKPWLPHANGIRVKEVPGLTFRDSPDDFSGLLSIAQLARRATTACPLWESEICGRVRG
jgi:hypothetical protein